MEDTITMAQHTERALRLKLHKINMQAAGLIVKSVPASNGSSLLTGAFDDEGQRHGGIGGFMNFKSSNTGKLKRGSSGIGGGFSNMI
jgi:hypothetical protein